MNIAQIIQRYKDWEYRGSRHMAAAALLRSKLVREVWIVALFALAMLAAFMSWDGVSSEWLRFVTLQPAIWLFLAALCQRKSLTSERAAVFARAALFTGVIEMATLPTVRYPYPQFGGVMVLTIVVAGLLTSQKMVCVASAIACVMQVSQMAYPGNRNLNANAGWFMVYAAAGGLVILFSRNLEHFFEANQMAYEQQRGAIVAERTRFARDMHDTLAQGFTGIMMQLNAAEQRLGEDSGQARLHLEKARQLASDSLEAARRSVSALRETALSNGTLLAAIEQIGYNVAPESGITLESKLEGRPYSLPERCESSLLRIAQELVTNAVQHARASTIRVVLAYRTGAVVLEVAEAGHGKTSSEGLGLGIDDMRERARQMGGEIQIVNDPDRGSRIVVTVPNA